MAVLVDSNVLIFSIQHGHPWHQESIQAMERLLIADELVCVLVQNIAEFWNVCTRPADKNGLGLSPLETDRRLNRLDTIVTVLHDTPAVYERWRRLIVEHAVKGIQAHDARIAAAMHVHGIVKILTYNPKDFNRYDGIIPVHPRDVITEALQHY